MRTRILPFFAALPVIFLSNNLAAQEYDFSLGSGYPFFFNAEVSMPVQEDKGRAWLSYRASLDHGAAIGYEYALDNQNQHAVGVIGGALGMKMKDCDGDDNTFGCALTAVFSDSAINGLGVTYSFSPYGLNNEGFKLRLEAGRGKISNRDGYYNGANLVLSYQF